MSKQVSAPVKYIGEHFIGYIRDTTSPMEVHFVSPHDTDMITKLDVTGVPYTVYLKGEVSDEDGGCETEMLCRAKEEIILLGFGRGTVLYYDGDSHTFNPDSDIDSFFYCGACKISIWKADAENE